MAIKILIQNWIYFEVVITVNQANSFCRMYFQFSVGALCSAFWNKNHIMNFLDNQKSPEFLGMFLCYSPQKTPHICASYRFFKFSLIGIFKKPFNIPKNSGKRSCTYIGFHLITPNCAIKIKNLMSGACSWVICKSNGTLKMRFGQFVTEIGSKNQSGIPGFENRLFFNLWRPLQYTPWARGANPIRFKHF